MVGGITETSKRKQAAIIQNRHILRAASYVMINDSAKMYRIIEKITHCESCLHGMAY